MLATESCNDGQTDCRCQLGADHAGFASGEYALLTAVHLHRRCTGLAEVSEFMRKGD